MEIGVLSTVRYLLGAAEGDVTMPFLLLLHALSCRQVIDLNLRKTQEFDGHKESCSNGMCHAGTIICSAHTVLQTCHRFEPEEDTGI